MVFVNFSDSGHGMFLSGLSVFPDCDLIVHRSTGLHILLCACSLVVCQTAETATELSSSR